MIEGSGSGSIPLTSGSGSGSWRPKTMWIRWIRNTDFNPKNVSKLSEYDPGSGSWFFYLSRDPGSRGQKDPGSGSATLFAGFRRDRIISFADPECLYAGSLIFSPSRIPVSNKRRGINLLSLVAINSQLFYFWTGRAKQFEAIDKKLKYFFHKNLD